MAAETPLKKTKQNPQKNATPPREHRVCQELHIYRYISTSMGISFIYFNALISITEFNPHPDLVFDARFSREVAFTEIP